MDDEEIRSSSDEQAVYKEAPVPERTIGFEDVAPVAMNKTLQFTPSKKHDRNSHFLVTKDKEAIEMQVKDYTDNLSVNK